MDLSICIPVYNEIKYTKQILDNIKNTISGKYSYEIIIIDDGSSDGTTEWLMHEPHIFQYGYKLKARKNKGVTKTWNELVKIAKGNNIIVINNDILFKKDWDNAIIEGLKDATMVGPMTQFGIIPFYGQSFHKDNIICGWCFAFKKIDRDNIFPIDERIKIRYNDDWLYNKVNSIGGFYKRLGMIVHHFGSATIKNIDISKQVKEDQSFYNLICNENGRKPRVL